MRLVSLFPVGDKASIRRLFEAFSAGGSDDLQGSCRCRHNHFHAAKRTNLRDIADRQDVDYHRMYRLVDLLGIELERDPVTDDIAIDSATEIALLTEVNRVDALRNRARTIAGATHRLRTDHSTVRLFVRRGQLDVHPETDPSGARFITYGSIHRSMRGT